MEIDAVRLELVPQYTINIDDIDQKVYGIETAAKIFVKELGKRNVETVGLICLDNTNKIINYANISIGNIESVKVNIAEIFKVALLSNASKLMIAHNHPSGVLNMTDTDITLTKNIGAIAKIFNMQLIDSVIVNAEGEFLSIRESISGEVRTHE